MTADLNQAKRGGSTWQSFLLPDSLLSVVRRGSTQARRARSDHLDRLPQAASRTFLLARTVPAGAPRLPSLSPQTPAGTSSTPRQGMCKACAASRRRRPFGAASCVLSFACPRPAGEPLLAKGLPDCSDCTPTWGSAQRPSSAGACGARPLALWHSGYPRGPCAAQAVTAFCADSASAPRQASSSCACWHTGQRGLAHARPSFRGRFSGYAMARRQAGRNGQMQGPCVRSASPPVRSALTGRRGILTIRDVLRAGCKSPPAVLS